MRKQTRGRFIAIEGGEGVGKSSVMRFLEKELRGHDVVFTHEPGGTPVAERIRDVLLDESEETIYTETELMLFCAARFQHVRNYVLPALENGTHVITDRFSLSTEGYQLYRPKRQDLRELFTLMNRHAVGSYSPRLYLLLDCDAETARARRHNEGEPLTRFDKEDIETYKRIRQGLLESVKHYPHTIVDARKPLEVVCREVLERVKLELGIL